jgi:type IV fimbrial biogenesis protein FimT
MWQYPYLSCHHKPHIQRGFTLLELLVTLAIAGVLMAVAMPDFVKATRTIQMNHQAKELIAGIKLARAEATRLRQRVVMCRSNANQTACNSTGSAGWENGWLIFKDLNGNRRFEETQAELIFVKQRLPKGITIQTAGAAQIEKYLEFNAVGESAGTAGNVGSFRVSHSSFPTSQNDLHILVSRSGRVRLLTDEQCLQAGSGCLGSN